MKTNLRKLRKKRGYYEAFKKQLVADFESGQYSVLELERQGSVSRCDGAIRISFEAKSDYEHNIEINSSLPI
jgi:hypothetical protein